MTLHMPLGRRLLLAAACLAAAVPGLAAAPVSYTHLTLPTILRV